jgi:methionine-rich copper-binding protein CopC
MKKINVLGMSLIVAALALFSQVASAHASLKKSSPAAGATIDVAPKEITLTFSEHVEEAFSTVTVKDATGKDVSTAKSHVDAADGATLHFDVPALQSGVYTVQWAAVTHDSHRRTGDFKFTVK